MARQKVDLEPYYSERPGWAEQDPLYYWRSLCEACHGLWAQGVDRESLIGVGLTTLRATMVCVDEGGDPLRPAIVWLDQRRTEGVPPVGGFWGMTFRTLGLSETVANFQANAEAIWIARHQPDVWERTHKFLFLSGFLTHRLTGRFAFPAPRPRAPSSGLAMFTPGPISIGRSSRVSPTPCARGRNGVNVGVDAP